MRTLSIITLLFAHALLADVVEPIFVCDARPCADAAPTSPFEMVACADYDLNDALIESMQRGDRSATDLLRQRYETTFTWSERHRIAGALLGRASDDGVYWNELSGRAKEAIRFAYVDDAPTLEFVQWCQARGVDPDEYRWMTLNALEKVAGDRRARGLVIEALRSNDETVVRQALAASLGGDESLLPHIEQAMARFPDEAADMAMGLVLFRSAAADRIAMKLIPPERHAEYAEQRRLAD